MPKKNSKSIQKKKTTQNSIASNSLWKNNWIHYMCLFLGAFIIYGWTYTFDYNLDDRYSINQLNNIGYQFTDMFLIFKKSYVGLDYRPIPILSFWLERQFLGFTSPHFSHFINVCIFLVLLIIIYKLTIQIKFYEDKNQLMLLAFISAIIFLIHPNHVSVVANIKSRDNLLSMLFGLLFCLNFLKFYDNKKWYYIVFSIISVGLATLSKLDAYSLIILPILIILFYRKNNLKYYVLYGLGILFFIFLFFNFRYKMMEQVDYNFVKSNFLDLSKNPLFIYDSTLNRLSLALTSLLYYYKFLIIPSGYYFYFGYNQIPLTPLFSLLNVIAFLVTIAMLVMAYLYLKKDRIFLFSLLFFGISIVYALNYFQIVAGIIMDRYNFIASLAFCWVLAALILHISTYQKYKQLLIATLVILFVVFTGATIYRTSAWKNENTLFTRDIKHLNNSFIALKLISGYNLDEGLKLATSVNQKDTTANNYMQTANMYADSALKVFTNSTEIWQIKGVIDLYNGRDSSALLKFQKGFNIDSNYLANVNYIGVAFRNLNNFDSAYYYFNWVANKEVFYNYSANNLIDLLVNAGQIKTADSVITHFQNRFPNDNSLINKRQWFNNKYNFNFN